MDAQMKAEGEIVCKSKGIIQRGWKEVLTTAYPGSQEQLTVQPVWTQGKEMDTLLNDRDMGLLFCRKTKILVGKGSRTHKPPIIKEDLWEIISQERLQVAWTFTFTFILEASEEQGN